MLDGNSVRKTEGAAARASAGATQSQMIPENYHSERADTTTKSDQRKVAEAIAEGLMVLPPAGGLPPLLQRNSQNRVAPVPPAPPPARQKDHSVTSLPMAQRNHSVPPAFDRPVQDNVKQPEPAPSAQADLPPAQADAGQRPQLQAVPLPSAYNSEPVVQPAPNIDEMLVMMREAQASMEESQRLLEEKIAAHQEAADPDAGGAGADVPVEATGQAPQHDQPPQPAAAQPPHLDDMFALVRSAAATAAAEAEAEQQENERLEAARREEEQLEAERQEIERQEAQAASAPPVNQPCLQRANYFDVRANQAPNPADRPTSASEQARVRDQAPPQPRPMAQPDVNGASQAGEFAHPFQDQYQPQQPPLHQSQYAGQYPGAYGTPQGGHYQASQPACYPPAAPYPPPPYQPNPMAAHYPQAYYAAPPPPVYYQQPVYAPQPSPPQVIQHVFSTAGQGQPVNQQAAQPAPPAATHHPSPGEVMMASLLQHLPPPGEVWPDHVRRKWLRAAGNMFEIAYGDVHKNR